MNNLNRHFKTVAGRPQIPMPTGSRKEVGLKLIQQCRERDARLEQQALEAERDGDVDGCWLAMAARAENKRALDKIQSDLDKEQSAITKQ